MIRTGFYQSKRSQFRCYSTFVRPKGTSDFLFRHIGPQPKEIEHMLRVVGPFDNLDTLTESIIPSQILQKGMKAQFDACSEANALQQLEKTMMKNRVNTSCIGEGYFGTHLPSAIQRNLLENPAWYTPYTPYQAEISQGRLESLMNFQTMICELTRMELCNASLLDEATAAAEAAFMCSNIHDRDASKRTHFIVDSGCYQRTIEMVKTRCEGKRIKVTVMALEELVNRDDLLTSTCGVLIQYPNNIGKINTSLPSLVENLKRKNVLLVAAVDLLALTRVIPPGELGFDICVGTAQRFGVPMGFGGPHAAYLATKDSYKRAIPGRIIGRSRDATGQPALRMALQTREQHIRRAKASSNICTAQALLANISAFYGIYHGPEGLQRIAERVHNLALNFHALATKLQVALKDDCFFDTVYLAFRAGEASNFNESAMKNGINVRMVDSDSVCVSFDETTEHSVLETLKDILRSICDPQSKIDLVDKDSEANSNTLRNNGLIRKTPFMLQPVFNMYHSETALMRYMNSLCRKDYGLTVGMIPLGSCTMKLNSASELIPLTWKTISSLHPFCPSSQSAGYQEMLNVLRERLAELMGFDDVLLQPNSGAQGEYAGLRAIRAYHESRNEGFRDKCFVLQSAHGTNPASAVMAGLVPIEIKCLDDGTTDINDLKSKIEQHSRTIACIMITYPSTYGIFEPEITHICDMIHSAGGQVYIDGANLNAMVGLATPGDIGGDVAHTNLHKTFAIPHGGGGPGQGPIGVKKHLIPFLPGNEKSFGAVSQAFYGSASILNISYMYLQMMGNQGLRLASQVAILSANYLRVRLMKYYPTLFCSGRGCAHEFILDLRKLKQSSGVDAEDIAKRLMDYNFHAPTLSFPIPNTIMIEPTESEPLSELDRLADALIAIRSEIQEIENGAMPREKNVLKNAPHTQDVLVKEIWDRPYTREKAVFPNDYVRKNKFWPSVSRIDGTWGDKNFRCASCT